MMKKMRTKQVSDLGAYAKVENGKIVIHIPIKVEKQAKNLYNFSFDMLKVGGDLTLPELAEHLDEQATYEARFGYLSEVARHEMNIAEQSFDTWFAKQYDKVRERLTSGTKIPTDKAISSYIRSKNGDLYMKYKQRFLDAELNYRLLRNVIFAAIETKGRMLQSLRNVVQGNNPVGMNVQIDGNRIKT